MWMLSTSSAELVYFESPEDVPGGYVVLSHVWDKTEMTYQDLRDAQAHYRATQPPRGNAQSIKETGSWLRLDDGYPSPDDIAESHQSSGSNIQYQSPQPDIPEKISQTLQTPPDTSQESGSQSPVLPGPMTRSASDPPSKAPRRGYRRFSTESWSPIQRKHRKRRMLSMEEASGSKGPSRRSV